MKTLLIATVSGVAMLAAAGVLHAKAAEPAQEQRGTTLELSAYGEAQAQPDMASFTVGVNTTAPTAGAAMAQNAELTSKALDALRRAGVAEKDIRTSSLNLQAQYVYKQGEAAKLTGWQATHELAVIVYDLKKLGPVLDAAVAGGGDQLSGVTLGIRDVQSAQDAARLAAVKALQAKAKLYADAVGGHGLKLKALSEGAPVSRPEPLVRVYAAKANATPVTPIAEGELTLHVDVQGVFEAE